VPLYQNVIADCGQCKCRQTDEQIEVAKQKIQQQSAGDGSESQSITARERRNLAASNFFAVAESAMAQPLCHLQVKATAVPD